MSDEEFYQLNCQYWQACASESSYYDDNNNNRYLFTKDNMEGESRGYADDATWILTSSFVIFTMQSGFGLLEAGSCSPGFEVNIMMKNIVDVVFTALSYYLVGYGISFGEPSTPFMGLGSMPADGGYEEVTSGLIYSQYIFQLSFAATSTTIVSGCVAMRLKFFVYILYSLLAVIFYAFVAHWIFADNGWLVNIGAHDFAGAAPVHVFGGINGLVATLFLGPRGGRFDGTRPITDFIPSSPSSQCLGLLVLWWGWIGFNCGSSFGITDERWVVAIRCAVTTINATVGGGVISILYTLWRTQGRLIIPEHVINGILSSLVAITAPCASVATWAAFPIGGVGALIGLGCNTFVCHCKVDDPVGAIGVHAGAGAWGLIAVGLFADSRLVGIDVMDGLFYSGSFKLLGVQLLAIVAAAGWALMWSTCFFYLIGVALSKDWKNPRKGLRVDLIEEERGADWHLHGVIDHAPSDVIINTNLDDSISSDEDPFSEHEGLGTARKKRLPSLTKKSDMYIRSALMMNPLAKQQLTKETIANMDEFEEHAMPNEKEKMKIVEPGDAEEEDLFHSARSLSVNDLDEPVGKQQDNNASHSASQRVYNATTPMGLPKMSTARHNRSNMLGMSMTSSNSNNRSSAMRMNRRISGERVIQTNRETFRLYR